LRGIESWLLADKQAKCKLRQIGSSAIHVTPTIKVFQFFWHVPLMHLLFLHFSSGVGSAAMEPVAQLSFCWQ